MHCKHCHHEFFPTNKHQTHCSSECRIMFFRNIAKINRKQIVDVEREQNKKTCLYCQKEFATQYYKSEKTKFCSSVCKSNYHKSIKRQRNQQRLLVDPILPRECVFCKKTFTPTRRCNEEQRFCSKKCKIDDHAQNQREARTEARLKITRICPICEKEFTPKRTLKEKYCSRRCCYLFPKKIYKALQTCYNYMGEKKQDHTHKLLGFTPRQLQEHIMNHPNWPNVKDHPSWHLDHVFPIIAFLEHGIKDIAIMCRLDNLQPLTGKANCQKRHQYNEQEFKAWLHSIESR